MPREPGCHRKRHQTGRAANRRATESPATDGRLARSKAGPAAKSGAVPVSALRARVESSRTDVRRKASSDNSRATHRETALPGVTRPRRTVRRQTINRRGTRHPNADPPAVPLPGSARRRSDAPPQIVARRSRHPRTVRARTARRGHHPEKRSLVVRPRANHPVVTVRQRIAPRKTARRTGSLRNSDLLRGAPRKAAPRTETEALKNDLGAGRPRNRLPRRRRKTPSTRTGRSTWPTTTPTTPSFGA